MLGRRISDKQAIQVHALVWQSMDGYRLFFISLLMYHASTAKTKQG